jgi:hypothetical protein
VETWGVAEKYIDDEKEKKNKHSVKLKMSLAKKEKEKNRKHSVELKK